MISVRRQKDDMQVNVAGIRRNIKNLAHNYSDPQVCYPLFISCLNSFINYNLQQQTGQST